MLGSWVSVFRTKVLAQIVKDEVCNRKRGSFSSFILSMSFYLNDLQKLVSSCIKNLLSFIFYGKWSTEASR